MRPQDPEPLMFWRDGKAYEVPAYRRPEHDAPPEPPQLEPRGDWIVPVLIVLFLIGAVAVGVSWLVLRALEFFA